MLKIDAQAPIPRAIIVTATIVNPRFFRNVRQAKPISLMKESMSAGRAGVAPFLFGKGRQTDRFGRPALNCSLVGFMSHYRTSAADTYTERAKDTDKILRRTNGSSVIVGSIRHRLQHDFGIRHKQA